MQKLQENKQAPLIITTPAGTGPWIVGGVILLVGGYFAKKAYDKYRQDQETGKTGEDPNANLAQQIHSEVSAYPANDDVIISLFKQVKDFKEVSKHYRILSGKDILEHVKSNVSATAYKQILNLIGYSSGAFKPEKKQTVAVQKKAGLFIVAKGDTYLRKTPVIPVCSRFVPDSLCYRENVITPIKAGEFIGVSSANNASKQDEFTDKKSGVIFIEVKVMDTKGKGYNAYIAASRINTFAVFDKKWKWRKFSPAQYQRAKAPLNGFNNLL